MDELKEMTKECVDCKQILPIDEFYCSVDKRYGKMMRYSRCKKCLAIRRAQIATGKIDPSREKKKEVPIRKKNIALEEVTTLAKSKHMSYGEYMQHLYRTEGRYC